MSCVDIAVVHTVSKCSVFTVRLPASNYITRPIPHRIGKPRTRPRMLSNGEGGHRRHWGVAGQRGWPRRSEVGGCPSSRHLFVVDNKKTATGRRVFMWRIWEGKGNKDEKRGFTEGTRNACQENQYYWQGCERCRRKSRNQMSSTRSPGGGGAVEERGHAHSRTLSRQHLASSSVVEAAGNLINLPRHKQFPPYSTSLFHHHHLVSSTK